MSDEVPIITGASGLTGRPKIARIPDEYEQPVDVDPATGELIYQNPPAPGKAIPPNCLRVLNSPLPVERGGGCTMDCPGLQRDGGCLCDIVRTANELGVDWQFEVDPRDNRWIYVGPELPGVHRYDPREVHVTTHDWSCPHCGNFHIDHPLGNWWCVSCGKNANDK